MSRTNSGIVDVSKIREGVEGWSLNDRELEFMASPAETSKHHRASPLNSIIGSK
ncbi:hypothetical protein BT69DRAFT_1275772 [Atractiella rhizophila]|nr:hypothetical protein BT69DRAFT_1275772 [Atractiella rhizophila]